MSINDFDFAPCASSTITKSTVSTLEKIKNGLFFSGKYDSIMVYMKKKPLVIVFANRPPNPEWYSEDRLALYEINRDNYEAQLIKQQMLKKRFNQWTRRLEEEDRMVDMLENSS